MQFNKVRQTAAAAPHGTTAAGEAAAGGKTGAAGGQVTQLVAFWERRSSHRAPVIDVMDLDGSPSARLCLCCYDPCPGWKRAPSTGLLAPALAHTLFVLASPTQAPAAAPAPPGPQHAAGTAGAPADGGTTAPTAATTAPGASTGGGGGAGPSAASAAAAAGVDGADAGGTGGGVQQVGVEGLLRRP